ncbi:MAG TPA: GMC family oxidoreductase [Kofleriaceae bacterium]|nr:GMC family oxidoreductase [Kofleriaceae bacterium]
MDEDRWDFVIVGSGFGGSVSALRLVEKGYRVLVLEKGRRLGAADFPTSNWRVRRWLWLPAAGCRGLFQMTFLRHVTALSGVGVGGGSLVYANTLPIPGEGFFRSPSWAHLADWKAELAEHYRTARHMLGAVENPNVTYPDEVIRELAADIGRPDHVRPTTVAVYFGRPGVTVPDPYFGGRGPERTGCIQCGGCMLGCRFGAKNTLDKNYLHLAEHLGLVIRAESEVTVLEPDAGDGGGYRLEVREGAPGERKTRVYRAGQVILSGGVLGTLDLLLRMQERARRRAGGLDRLSPRLGHFVRTNSEVLMGVTTRRRDVDLSRGIAIGSILDTDDHSHLEPVRYPSGSGFFRMLMAPHAPGEIGVVRLARALAIALRHPVLTIRAYLVPDWARYTMILLYMRTLEGHLRIRLGRPLLRLFRRGLTTEVSGGPRPSASIPEATELGRKVAARIDGFASSMITETALGIPTTAHILGGCVMADGPEAGVIDHQHRVFGHPGLYVIDGSAVSANPGVNPSLTICALAERAMTFIPARAQADDRPGRGGPEKPDDRDRDRVQARAGS